MTNSRFTAAGLLFSICLTAWGCSTPSTPYAEAYRDALDRYQGTAAVTPAMTDRFVAFFSHQNGSPTSDEEAAPDAADLYGEPLYFSDTLLTSQDRSAVLRHLKRMRDNTRSVAVTVLDRQISGQDVYLIWHMTATFEPVASPVTSSSLGVTHLRFGPAGRIVLQQDFWDSAEGLYRHVPVLGGLIGAVKGRFEAPD